MKKEYSLNNQNGETKTDTFFSINNQNGNSKELKDYVITNMNGVTENPLICYHLLNENGIE